MERLQKYLARAGISSRRAAEQLILDGRVKVNGQVITTLGTKVDGHKDLVVMDGAPVVASNERQWYLFYKPPGVVTTMHDPQGRPTVGEYVEKLEGRVFPVGRLDYDAEGALLLTDDGETANKLMHPKHQVPRVYLAKVKGAPDDASLEKLRGGVRLEDGMATPTEVSRFEKAEKNTWLKIVVTEGRPHLVKRLCAAIGHPVVRLYRPQHAGIGVEGVKPGEFRALTAEEVKQVKAAGDGRSLTANELRLPARRHGHGASSNDSPARPSGRALSEEEETHEPDEASVERDEPEVRRAPRERVSTGGRSGVMGPRAGAKPRAAVATRSASAEKDEGKPFRAPRFGAAFKPRDESGQRTNERKPERGGGEGRGRGLTSRSGAAGGFKVRTAVTSERGTGFKGRSLGDAGNRPGPSSARRVAEVPDTGYRGRSAKGDEGGGSFDTSPNRVESERGGVHRGTSAGARAAANPGGYKGSGVATGGDRFSTRTAVKGAFGNRTAASKERKGGGGGGERKGPPRGGKGAPRGGKGGFRGGR